MRHLAGARSGDTLARDLGGKTMGVIELVDVVRAWAGMSRTEVVAASGAALGMGTTAKTEFIDIAPEVVAEVQQSAGGVFDPGAESQDPVFDEFKVVKSVAGG